MSGTKGILSDGDYYCDHIKETDLEDIKDFTVRDPDIAGNLAAFIKEWAWDDENEGLMRTYIVRDQVTDEIVGYFAIKAAMMSVNERKKVDRRTGKERIYFDTMPGIEIANFAVNETYIGQNEEVRGIGVLIFYEFIYKIITGIAEMLGVKYLFIYALPYDTLIQRYMKYYHFRRLPEALEQRLHKRIKPEYDDDCVFMYQKLRG